MKAEIFLVTYAKDYDFTSYTLRTIQKFASGFAGITIVVPTRDEGRFRPLADRFHCNLRSYYESESKGFLHHQVCKCEADLWCPRGTDLVVHIDSDCIFKEPFSPETFLKNGKPILVREHFGDFVHYAARSSWRGCVEYALGIDMEWETMVRHPGVFWAGMYKPMRARVEERHHYPFTQYVLLQRNEFPQSFAEFPTIGGYALAFEPERYQVVTRVKTPGAFWATKPEWGITPLPRDDKGKPIGEVDYNLWHYGTEVERAGLTDPVQYFWSRGGVTPQYRAQIERILNS